MLWIILSLIILLLLWILLSPLELKIDTRVPVVTIQWTTIGSAVLVFENDEWQLKIRVLLFSKKWDLVQMIFADRKEKKNAPRGRKENKKGKQMPVLKFIKIFKTFQMVHWEIAFGADNYSVNAMWYWLNFFPLTSGHVHINFVDENYLVLVIKNKAWRMVYAFIK